MKHTIRVTQEHIENGKQGSQFTCPIALALRDKFPHFTFRVSPSQVQFWLTDSPKARAIHEAGCFDDYTDNLIYDFIKHFDVYGKRAVTPFEFEIELEGVNPR